MPVKSKRLVRSSGKERSQRNAATSRPAGPRRRVTRTTIVGIGLAAVLILLLGRGTLAWWARQQASNHLQAGALTDAQHWLQRAAWLVPQDGRIDLLQAACHRRLQEVEGFLKAVESAKSKGTHQELIQREVALGQIHAGKMGPRPELQLNGLIQAGLPVNDVVAAFVYGFLIRDEPEAARKVLDAWADDRPQDPDVAYMNGVYWHWLGDSEKAEAELTAALAHQVRHELSRSLLAELLEEQDRLEEACQQYRQWTIHFPANQTAQAGLAAMLRQTGRGEEARAILSPLASQSPPPAVIAVGMSQLELDAGNYDAALQWFRQVPVSHFVQDDLARDLAITLALVGRPLLASELFSQIDARFDRQKSRDDLQTQAAAVPNEEQNMIHEVAAASDDGADSIDVERFLAEVTHSPPAASAAELYASHCSVCHGAEGDGEGRAARDLFPRPLNFRDGRFRLASTYNGVATPEDVATTIRRGIPGTSMPSFENLGEDAIRQLAEETLRIHREGLHRQFIARLQSEAMELDEKEIQALVTHHTTPGDEVRVPEIGPVTQAAITRGKELYVRMACHHCHGDDGTGLTQGRLQLLDELGQPSLPRDLVHDPFKGGEQPEAIYRRLFVGMPGTPHPSISGLPEDQIIDLVQYVRSLSQTPKRVTTNSQRRRSAEGL